MTNNKMEYDHENTMRLIGLAQNGDQSAKEQLITENTPLIKSIVKRYIGKGVEYNDLMQIAGMGLLKAVYNSVFFDAYLYFARFYPISSLISYIL